MGFFSDLKDDLSQAVNELAPEDGLQAVQDLSLIHISEPTRPY